MIVVSVVVLSGRNPLGLPENRLPHVVSSEVFQEAQVRIDTSLQALLFTGGKMAVSHSLSV